MTQTRRQWLATADTLPFAGLLPDRLLTPADAALPAKQHFAIQGTYLNAAYTHPMSLASTDAVRQFLDNRMVNGKGTGVTMEADRHPGSIRRILRFSFTKIASAFLRHFTTIWTTLKG